MIGETFQLRYGQARQGDFTKEGASHRLTKCLTKPYPRMWYILVMSKLVTRTSHRTLGLIWWSKSAMSKLVTKMSHQMVRLWLVRRSNYVMVNRAKAILLKKRRLTVSPNVSPNLTPECDTFVKWATSLLKRLTEPWDPNSVMKWLVTK